MNVLTKRAKALVQHVHPSQDRSEKLILAIYRQMDDDGNPTGRFILGAVTSEGKSTRAQENSACSGNARTISQFAEILHVWTTDE